MEIPEFADKMDHLIGAFRTGALNDEEFWKSSLEIFDKILDTRLKKDLMDSSLPEEVKKQLFPEEFPES